MVCSFKLSAKVGRNNFGDIKVVTQYKNSCYNKFKQTLFLN